MGRVFELTLIDTVQFCRGCWFAANQRKCPKLTLEPQILACLKPNCMWRLKELKDA